MPADEQMSDRKLLQETHDAVIELKAIVVGVGGRGGLISELTEVKLKVQEMTISTEKGKQDVAQLLRDASEMVPRLSELDGELHSKGGLCDRLVSTETKQADNRKLIIALWGVLAVLGGALLTLVLTHVTTAEAFINAVTMFWISR